MVVRGKARTKRQEFSEPKFWAEYLSGAVANRIDVALGVEALGIDFLGGHVLALAVGAWLVDPPALDELLVAFLRIRALLFLSLRNVLVHGALGVAVFRCWVVGGSLGCRFGSPGRRRGRSVAGSVRAEQFDHFCMHAIRRPIAVLQLTLCVDPLVDDSRGQPRPSKQRGT